MTRGALYLNNDWVYEYQYKDHLGNLRVAFREKGGVAVAVQVNSFDPWGNSLVGINQEQGDTTDTYLYQGYEREYAFGLNLDDAVARFYDPQIGRMHGIDQVDHHSMSSYAAMGNNPISMIDPDGRNPIAIGFMVGMFASSINHAINGTMPSGIGDFLRPGVTGAIGGGISHGIGTAFGQMGNFTGKGLLQAGVHALSGGVQSAAFGGDFWQGAISSGISSGTASLASAAGLGDVGTILAGGLAGGLSAQAFGGGFWEGARNGLIVAGLNHIAHPRWDLNGDGKLQKEEADYWWINGKGKPIWVNNEKIDWAGLSIPKNLDENNGFGLQTHEAFSSLSYETAATYGGTYFKILNRASNTVQVIDQDYHYNIRNITFSRQGGKDIIRNIFTYIGQPKTSNGATYHAPSTSSLARGQTYMIHFSKPVFRIK